MQREDVESNIRYALWRALKRIKKPKTDLDYTVAAQQIRKQLELMGHVRMRRPPAKPHSTEFGGDEES